MLHMQGRVGIDHHIVHHRVVNPYALGRQRATADDPPHLGNNNAAAVVGGGGQFGGIVAHAFILHGQAAVLVGPGGPDEAGVDGEGLVGQIIPPVQRN